MNKLFITRIVTISGALVKSIIIEGTISMAAQKLREVSKVNYTTTKDSIKQVVNLTSNEINGTGLDDWDFMLK